MCILMNSTCVSVRQLSVRAPSSHSGYTAFAMSCPHCLGGAALQVALSYVLDPRLMSTLCSVSVAFNDACCKLESWRDLVVDAPEKWKPLGVKACNSHWGLWKFTKAICVRPWMFASCTFLIGSCYKPWKWVTPPPPRPFVPVYPTQVALGVALAGSPWRHCKGHWVCIGSPVPSRDVRMRLEKADCIPPGFVIGMADTCCPREITTLLCGYGGARWGVVERGPPPMQLVYLNFYHGAFRGGSATLRWNAVELQGRQEGPTEFYDGDIVTLGACSGRLSFGIGNDCFDAPLSAEVRCDDLYYPVLACVDVDEGGTVNPGLLPIPEPLLCDKQ